ncbi:MAG: endonuclease MutS2 [Armatimonadota bacterium]|nr:endonuclease MutS2 [Armatimonadota bacterium]
MDRTHAQRVLELNRLLERVAARCQTEIGAEVLLSIEPTFDRILIEKRIGRTAEARELISLGDLPVYGNARDVRAQVRNAAKGSMLAGDTIFRTSETLGALARVRKWMQNERENAPLLWRLAETLPFLADLQRRIESSVSPEGDVLDSASPELKTIRIKKNTQAKRIVERIQSMVSSMKSYLQDPLYTQRSGRYVLPVKAPYKGKVPGIVHDSSGSGQTLFIEPQAVVTETNKLREIEGTEREEVEKVLLALSSEIGSHAEEIVAGLSSLAEIDAVVACANDAQETEATAPKLVGDPLLKIEKGHHPLLDREISVPFDVAVGGSLKSLLITGPNTGGKTVCLKTLGLYSLMIGCGLFPPAKRVEYGVFSGIWADIGDEQSLEQSLSTFSGHLKNVARALNEATAGALCLFDEIGAGTDPAEGAAIGKAVLNTLAERGVVIAATTHYGELKQFALESDAFRTAAMEFDLLTLRPTYRLIPGATGASHAFEIARRYGLPDEVAKRAEGLLSETARSERDRSAQLDELIADAQSQLAEADQTLKQATADRAALKEERERQKEKLQEARESARDTLTEAIREMRAKYRELLDSTANLTGAKREEILGKARELEADFTEAAKTLADADEPAKSEVSVGDLVRVRGRAHAATVLEVQRSGSVVLQLGSVRFTVKPQDIEPVDTPLPRKIQSARKPVGAMTNVTTEISLRRMRVEEAQEVLEGYFDDAILAGIHQARIVHGKGDGILKKVVRDFLAGRREVSRYYEAPANVGGAGVTIVEFKS